MDLSAPVGVGVGAIVGGKVLAEGYEEKLGIIYVAGI